MSDRNTLPTNLEAFLKQNLEAGVSRFILDAELDDSGQATFKIKPLAPAAFMLDFRVRVNQLTTVFFKRSKTLGAGT